MKAPHYLTIIILLAGSLWGVRETRHLSVIRAQHAQLVTEAKALGVPGDSSQPYHPSRGGKRAREDGGRRVADIADGLAEFARRTREIEKSGALPDEDNQRRVVGLINDMLSLKGEELQQLIAGLRSRPDMDDEMRRNIVGFAIMMLAQNHPQTALTVFTESADLMGDQFMGSHVLSSALTQWAKDQPLAALEWIKKNAASHPKLVNDDAKVAVIAGAAQTDFKLAFQLGSELGIGPDHDGMLKRIAGAANTPERQLEFLAALRGQAAGMADKQVGGKLLDAGLRGLFPKLAESGFDQSMEWVESASLTDAEALKLSQGMNYHETKADTGKWLDWLSTRHPAEASADGRATHLVRDWTRNDYKAAGQWLADSPAGPLKDTATIAYLETVAPYDPDVAVQWAQTLTGDKEAESMKRILAAVALKDRAAGKAFAERHGLELKDD